MPIVLDLILNVSFPSSATFEEAVIKNAWTIVVIFIRSSFMNNYIRFYLLTCFVILLYNTLNCFALPQAPLPCLHVMIVKHLDYVCSYFNTKHYYINLAFYNNTSTIIVKSNKEIT